jgi:uncharacterized damage-inducible protein DinB
MYPRAVLRELLNHMEWADARVWAAVPRTAPEDARLHQLLSHIHTTQQAFLAIWTQADVAAVFREAASAATLSALEAWARPYYAKAHAHLDAVTADHLNNLIVMPWADQISAALGHPPGPTTFAETIFQVTSHSTYHRAQVNTRLKELGVTPPLVDYIVWLWSERPKPEWRP